MSRKYKFTDQDKLYFVSFAVINWIDLFIRKTYNHNMKKRIRETVGDLIKIPYMDGYHTYGRILIEKSYAIYDCPSTTDRKDYDAIIQSDILFVTHVDIFAVKEGYWTIETNIALDDQLEKFYPNYFNPAPMNAPNVNFYNIYKEEIEDAVKKDWIRTGKIQLDGIYGRVHVMQRINDYYEGKRNEGNKMNFDFFKKYIGLPVDVYNNP